MNYIDFMKNGGIHIKKENRGKFTDYCGGKVTTECIQRGKNSPSATIRKRATFAQNARSWSKHEEGGILHAQTGAKVNLSYQTLTKRTEDPEEVKLQNPEEESEETAASETSQPEETNWWDTKAEQYLQMSNNKSTSPYTGTADVMLQTALHSNHGAYQQTMQYLMSKGFNKEAAAGVAGVFMAESGLTAGRVNKEEDRAYGSTAGRGLGQWSNERRKQYDAYMADKEITLQNDLDFFIQDLRSRPLVKQALENATSVDDAVKAMHLGYENGSRGAMATPEQLTATYTKAWANLGYRPYNYDESHNKRLGFARQAYESV